MSELDYKVVKHLHEAKKPLKISQISKTLDVPHTTLGSCVKRLEKNNYVVYNRYKTVSLSEKGKNLAMELIRHSRLLEVLLFNELDLSKEEAHVEAEKFNLLFSCKMINKICEKYGHPQQCPCGKEILESSNCYCNEKH